MNTHRTLADYWASIPRYPLCYIPTAPSDPTVAPTDARTTATPEERS